LMKPYPFWVLNHFTVPCDIFVVSLCVWAAAVPDTLHSSHMRPPLHGKRFAYEFTAATIRAVAIGKVNDADCGKTCPTKRWQSTYVAQLRQDKGLTQ